MKIKKDPRFLFRSFSTVIPYFKSYEASLFKFLKNNNLNNLFYNLIYNLS